MIFVDIFSCTLMLHPKWIPGQESNGPVDSIQVTEGVAVDELQTFLSVE